MWLGDTDVCPSHTMLRDPYKLLCSVQQQDIDQCSQWRAHNVGYKQVGWDKVWCVAALYRRHSSSKSHVERRSKDHIRSINRLSVSRVVHYYCITGSADGDMRIWVCRPTSLVGDKHTDTSPGSERSLKVRHKSATFNIHSKHCLFPMCMATTTSHCGLG